MADLMRPTEAAETPVALAAALTDRPSLNARGLPGFERSIITARIKAGLDRAPRLTAFSGE